MSLIGALVIGVVMACAIAGALAAIRNEQSGLGREFLDGLHSIGPIFIPVAGIMASVPILSHWIEHLLGPAFALIGADKAMAATTVIAVDMGGYQLAFRLAGSTESWIMAMLTGYTAGATIVFSIPVGLSMLAKRDHKYMALGILSGVLSIPIGVFVACTLLMLFGPSVRDVVSTDAAATHPLQLAPAVVLRNLAPLVLFVALIAVGLRVWPDQMIRLFMLFGRVVDVAIKLVLVASIVEYFTGSEVFKGIWPRSGGVFSQFFNYWGFDPIIADDSDRFRALEVAGYIGCMLSGAFPMVYLIKKYLAKPVEKIGKRLGLETAGAAGLLAAAANILAMFRLVKEMRPKDKVLVIAFSVCSAFLFGDHLAFTANFQPNLLPFVMVGKFSGGVFAFFLAYKLSVPKALELEKQEMEEEVRALFPLMPALVEREVTLKVLGGGLTNRNFLVKTATATYVLRIAGVGTELLGIDREREVACSKAAAAAGVGPEVHTHLPEHRAMLSEFVHGRLLEAENVKDPAILRRIAHTMRRCHDHPVPADLGDFKPFEAIRNYRKLAHERNVPLPAELDRALDLLTHIEQETRTGEPACLCHNDLLAANFIDDGTTMRLIDWDYGGLGDRFFDLGNFAVNHQLDEAQERALLREYFGEVREDDLRRLRMMRLVSDLREATWGFLQVAISKLHSPAYYLEYGARHLNRFLAGATAVVGQR